LRRDELSDLFHWVDIGIFEVTLMDLCETIFTGYTHHRSTRGLSFAEQIAAQRFQARLICEACKCKLPQQLKLRLIVNAGENFAAFVDDDLRCLVGNGNAGLNDVTVHGDDLAIGVLVERPGARINNFAVCSCHLKPTTAIKRQIELIARVSERALNMELTNGCSAHPKANLCTFRNRALSAAIWSAC